MAVLIGMSGNLKGQRFELAEAEVPIGRHTTNTICFEDPSVSGQHCIVTREGQKYTVTDLESTNGTRLNGAPVLSSRLKPKDILQVGSIELMFDGTDVEVEEEQAEVAASRVETFSEPVAVPTTFQAGSPFGKRRDSRKPWVITTIALTVLILAALVFFLIRVYDRLPVP